MCFRKGVNDTQRNSDHLFLLTLSLHWNGVVTPVLTLCTEHTDAPVVVSTVQLQEPLVPFTDPRLQSCHRFNQLVNLQRCNPEVWLQVTGTIRGETHEARFHGLCLSCCAHVTVNDPFCKRCHAILPLLSDLLRHLLGKGIFTELRTNLKDGPTFGTADGSAVAPSRGDAGEAEAVAAGDGDGLREDILAEEALKLELHLGQQNTQGSHGLCVQSKQEIMDK